MLQYVVPDVKELYNWLEVDFHPLKLSGRVTKVYKFLAASNGVHLHYSHLSNLLYVRCIISVLITVGVELGKRPG